jgi:hypothetical protein
MDVETTADRFVGCSRWNSRLTSRDRCSLAESCGGEPSVIASAAISAKPQHCRQGKWRL